MVATAWTAWWSPSPFWRQSRRIFQFFMRAKVCSTRARTRRCSALSSSWPRRSGRPALLRCGTINPGAQVGAVCDDRRPGRDGGQVRFSPGVGVGLVPGDGAGGGDHQAAVRIDDDLHVRREPIVAGGRGDRTVADRDQGSVHDPQPLDIRDRPRRRLQREKRPQAMNDPADSGRGDPEQRGKLAHREVGPVVDGHQQDPVRQRQAPRAPSAGTVSSPLPHCLHQLLEPAHTQAGERLHPQRLSPQYPTHTRGMPYPRRSATTFSTASSSPRRSTT